MLSNSAVPIQTRVRRDLLKINQLITLVMLISIPALSADIYVVVGGTGTGTQIDPFGSIQMAVDVAQPFDNILIGPGTYNQTVTIHQKADLTIIGAGIANTLIRPVSTNGVLVQLSTAIVITDLAVENLTASGRGVVVKGADLTLTRISTFNTSHEGILVVEFMGAFANISLNECQIDASQFSAGFVAQTGVASVTANQTTFNGNGTGACGPCNAQYGRGMVIFTANMLDITDCEFDNNLDTGMKIAASSPIIFNMSGSSASDNLSNGLGIEGDVTTLISNSEFSRNGPVPRDPPVTGRNGIEFFINFVGDGLVANCVFVSNTTNGIFIGSGSVDVYDSTFDDNHTALSYNSTISTSTILSQIHRNIMQMESGHLDMPTGIRLNGGGISATLGNQECSDANTFINIRDMSSVICFNGAMLNLGKNIYIDSPNPIRHCEPNPPPSCGCETIYDIAGMGNGVDLNDLNMVLPNWTLAPTLIPDSNSNGILDMTELTLIITCIATQI